MFANSLDQLDNLNPFLIAEINL